jgi:hypothetical protein
LIYIKCNASLTARRSTSGGPQTAVPSATTSVADEAPLRPGDNEIIAGRADSLFVFTVHVAAGAGLAQGGVDGRTAT